MKFNELNATNSTEDQPSELVRAYCLHELDGGNLQSFLMQFDFDSKDDIQRAIVAFAYAVIADRHLSSREVQKNDARLSAIYKRYGSIVTNVDKFDKYPRTNADAIWYGEYSRMLLDSRTRKMFNVQPQAALFALAADQVKAAYGLTDVDIDKIRFFVEQTKAGAQFPDSLRRMLYLWSTEKETGKTTTGRIITCLLNGDDKLEHIVNYSSNLATEMQMGEFQLPKISECNCVMLDECFFTDMARSYSKFKSLMTTSNGRARLPYGMQFEWKGSPNYIATSNDSLRVFIKDWGDRRFLAVNFLIRPHGNGSGDDSEEAIVDMWRSFIINSTPRLPWREWAEEMERVANEIGERQERADEYEAEMRKKDFLTALVAQRDKLLNDSKSNPDNRITLKYFVDYFARIDYDARKHRGEIEAAVISVFGQRYSTQKYWLLTELARKANELLERVSYERDEQPF